MSIHTSDSTPVAKSVDGEVKKKAVQGKSIFSFLTMAPKPVSESSNSGRSSAQSSALKSVRVLNNVIIDEETRSSPSCNSPKNKISDHLRFKWCEKSAKLLLD